MNHEIRFTASPLGLTCSVPVLLASVVISAYASFETFNRRDYTSLLLQAPAVCLWLLCCISSLRERRWRIDAGGVIGFGFSVEKGISWGDVVASYRLPWGLVLMTANRTVVIPLLLMGGYATRAPEVTRRLDNALTIWGVQTVTPPPQPIASFRLAWLVWSVFAFWLWLSFARVAAAALTPALSSLVAVSRLAVFDCVTLLMWTLLVCVLVPGRITVQATGALVASVGASAMLDYIPKGILDSALDNVWLNAFRVLATVASFYLMAKLSLALQQWIDRP